MSLIVMSDLTVQYMSRRINDLEQIDSSKKKKKTKINNSTSIHRSTIAFTMKISEYNYEYNVIY